MNTAEKSLAKACNKIAKWYPESCRFQVMHNGFLLTLNGDSEFAPAIGVIDDQLVGALDAYDAILDVMEYECQIERILFDAQRQTFILDAGWSGKYWKKPTPQQVTNKSDFAVDAMVVRMPAKITAAALILIAVVAREGKRRLWKLMTLRKK